MSPRMEAASSLGEVTPLPLSGRAAGFPRLHYCMHVLVIYFLLSVLFYVGCVAGLCFFNVFVNFYIVLRGFVCFYLLVFVSTFLYPMIGGGRVETVELKL